MFIETKVKVIKAKVKVITEKVIKKVKVKVIDEITFPEECHLHPLFDTLHFGQQAQSEIIS